MEGQKRTRSDSSGSSNKSNTDKPPKKRKDFSSGDGLERGESSTSKANTPDRGTSDTQPHTPHSNPEGSSWLQREDELLLGVQLKQIESEQYDLLQSYARSYRIGQSDQLRYPSELSGAIQLLGRYSQLKQEDRGGHILYEKSAIDAARTTKNYLANHQDEITNSAMLKKLQEIFGS